MSTSSRYVRLCCCEHKAHHKETELPGYEHGDEGVRMALASIKLGCHCCPDREMNAAGTRCRNFEVRNALKKG